MAQFRFRVYGLNGCIAGFGDSLDAYEFAQAYSATKTKAVVTLVDHPHGAGNAGKILRAAFRSGQPMVEPDAKPHQAA
jgi:hypothetical protein